jgi:hypothetical protein
LSPRCFWTKESAVRKRIRLGLIQDPVSQVLLEKGASCEVRDRKYHMTPADWAKKYKRYWKNDPVHMYCISNLGKWQSTSDLSN